MRIILLGAPGAGKGTLATAICRQLDVRHISTGDILREEMKSGSPLGTEVKKFVESGALVPDDVITKIIEQTLQKSEDDGRGFMLDGFPRTQKQAEDLDAMLKRMNKPLDAAIFMEVSLPVIIQRLTGRRICRQCGAIFHITNMPPKNEGLCDVCSGELYQRPDDNEETIKTRMDVYMKNTEPVIQYYEQQGKLKKVNAEEKTENLVSLLKSALGHGQ